MARGGFVSYVNCFVCTRSLASQHYMLAVYYLDNALLGVLGLGKLWLGEVWLVYSKDGKNIFKMNKEVRMLLPKA